MKIKTGILCIVIVLTATGWFVSNAEDVGWVKKIIARDYQIAMETYEKMIDNKAAIKKGDKGFKQISKIVSEELSGHGDLTIETIKITNAGPAVFSNRMGLINTVSIEITLTDGRKTQNNHLDDISPKIKEEFLKKPIFEWGAFLFWLGIGIGFVSRIIEMRSERK